jgi:ankyrin repeat protein
MDLIIAAKCGDVEELGQLLTRDNVDEVVGGFYGWTILHYAAYHASIECITFCLHLNANVNVRDDFGQTPLHKADHVNVARVLLDAGAMVDATDQDGITPLHRAIQRDSDDVAKLLIDRGAIPSNITLKPRSNYAHEIQVPFRISYCIESRLNCRHAAIIVIGINKYHRTDVTGNNDVNVLKLIGKHI